MHRWAELRLPVFMMGLAWCSWELTSWKCIEPGKFIARLAKDKSRLAVDIVSSNAALGDFSDAINTIRQNLQK